MPGRVSKQSIIKLARNIEAVLQEHAHERPYVAHLETIAALLDVLTKKGVGVHGLDLSRVPGMQPPLGYSMQRWMEKHHAADWYCVGTRGPKYYRP
jgi:hypothetical protein